MKYSVKVVRNFYNDKAVREQKLTNELFYESIDTALSSYNHTIIGERITGEMHSVNGRSNIYVSLIARIDGEAIVLESTFIHNGEVQKWSVLLFAAEFTHSKGGTPRECVHAFSLWLLGSPCSREAYNKVVLYIVNRNI